MNPWLLPSYKIIASSYWNLFDGMVIHPYLQEIELCCSEFRFDVFKDTQIHTMRINCNDVSGDIPSSLRYLSLTLSVQSQAIQDAINHLVLNSEVIYYYFRQRDATHFQSEATVAINFHRPDKMSKLGMEILKKVYPDHLKAYEKGMICFEMFRFKSGWNKHATLLQHLKE
jgi:hypothetical protein